MKKIKSFGRNTEAATAIEYGLIAALIAVVLIAVLGNIGTGLAGAFTQVDEGIRGTGGE
jgi:pilus assembly protein Flp/PilA